MNKLPRGRGPERAGVSRPSADEVRVCRRHDVHLLGHGDLRDDLWRAHNMAERAPEGLTTAVGSVTGVIGTLVGAYFGHQLGAASKERAERRAAAARRESEDARREKEQVKSKVLKRRVLNALPREEAERLLDELGEIEHGTTG
jgi:hypothetical protein